MELTKLIETLVDDEELFTLLQQNNNTYLYFLCAKGIIKTISIQKDETFTNYLIDLFQEEFNKYLDTTYNALIIEGIEFIPSKILSSCIDEYLDKMMLFIEQKYSKLYIIELSNHMYFFSEKELEKIKTTYKNTFADFQKSI